MKKRSILILLFLLSLIFVVSLSSCGEETESLDSKDPKAEMLDSGIEIDMETIQEVTMENRAKAKAEYCNKILILEGFVRSIEEDHVIFRAKSSKTYKNVEVHVYLPAEDLVNIETDQKIEVVGRTSGEIKEYTENELFTYYYAMEGAYLVTDVFEITGRLQQDEKNESGFNLEGYYIFPKEDFTPSLYLNKKITVSGKIFEKYVMNEKYGVGISRTTLEHITLIKDISAESGEIEVESLVSISGTYRDYEYSDHVINEKGQVVSAKVTGDDRYTVTYEYDEKGRLVKEMRDEDLYEYKYDDKGNLISEFQGDRLFENSYTFDDKGRVLTKISVNVTSDSRYTMVHSYTYNDDGTVETETQTSPNSTFVITFEYDDKGRVVKEYSVEKGETYRTSTTYKYDVVGRYIPKE